MVNLVDDLLFNAPSCEGKNWKNMNRAEFVNYCKGKPNLVVVSEFLL